MGGYLARNPDRRSHGHPVLKARTVSTIDPFHHPYKHAVRPPSRMISNFRRALPLQSGVDGARTDPAVRFSGPSQEASKKRELPGDSSAGPYPASSASRTTWLTASG
jgi:hypothetical protein